MTNQRIDIALLKKQRDWLLTHIDAQTGDLDPHAEGLVNLCDALLDELEGVTAVRDAGRKARVARLRERYGVDRGFDAAHYDGSERYALVTESEGQKLITTHKTFADACAYAGDEVLDGWDPHGIFDLDTGELINLHIASPVVTRSEDQGVLENPLEPCKHCGSPASAHDEVDQRCPDD